MNSKRSSKRGCPIRESSDLCLLPTPRSVSPVSAPFIVSECLGLHRKPSFLWPKNIAVLQKKNRLKNSYIFYAPRFIKTHNGSLLPYFIFWLFLLRILYACIHCKTHEQNRRVEIKGFEPLAPALQRQCSTNWAIFPFFLNFEPSCSRNPQFWFRIRIWLLEDDLGTIWENNASAAVSNKWTMVS